MFDTAQIIDTRQRGSHRATAARPREREATLSVTKLEHVTALFT